MLLAMQLSFRRWSLVVPTLPVHAVLRIPRTTESFAELGTPRDNGHPRHLTRAVKESSGFKVRHAYVCVCLPRALELPQCLGSTHFPPPMEMMLGSTALTSPGHGRSRTSTCLLEWNNSYTGEQYGILDVFKALGILLFGETYGGRLGGLSLSTARAPSTKAPPLTVTYTEYTDHRTTSSATGSVNVVRSRGISRTNMRPMYK
ncbi:hypothetical protein C8T65DRAFT_761286 [Cerioporus squamosus]|nr:hypothetical protein C8T65DRAFT_761286 [Cerioporus squamosus]